MTRSSRRPRGGFTLVELMVVVVVLGLLAAVATAAFTRYIKRSKTPEAQGNISKIYMAQMTYHHAALERSAPSFVNAAAVTPSANPSSARFPPSLAVWTSNTDWSALGFSLDTAHYYAYASPGVTTATTGTAFTAFAVGDLDGDDLNATYARTGVVVGGEIEGSAIMITEELE